MITYEQQLTALDESIAHWQRLASGKREPHESIGSWQCALCQLVDMLNNGCEGCPIVMINPQNNRCRATPYAAAYDAAWDNSPVPGNFDSTAFLSAAQRELEFLQQVREQFVKRYANLSSVS
jgi:hypothetical protein